MVTPRIVRLLCDWLMSKTDLRCRIQYPKHMKIHQWSGFCEFCAEHVSTGSICLAKFYSEIPKVDLRRGNYVNLWFQLLFFCLSHIHFVVFCFFAPLTVCIFWVWHRGRRGDTKTMPSYPTPLSIPSFSGQELIFASILFGVQFSRFLSWSDSKLARETTDNYCNSIIV